MFLHQKLRNLSKRFLLIPALSCAFVVCASLVPIRKQVSNLTNEQKTTQIISTVVSTEISKNVVLGDAEPADMVGITARHNFWRAQLGIAPLTWSNELAAFAQEWANELKRRGMKMEHRPRTGKFTQKYGENIYWSQGMQNSTSAGVDSWADERKSFDFDTQLCKGEWYVCGHYTQLIWENSTQVGCAKVVVDDQEIWLCNYNPPGNYTGQKPYVKKANIVNPPKEPKQTQTSTTQPIKKPRKKIIKK